MHLTVDDTIKDYENRIKILSEAHKDELMERDTKIQQQESKITRLRNQVEYL